MAAQTVRRRPDIRGDGSDRGRSVVRHALILLVIVVAVLAFQDSELSDIVSAQADDVNDSIVEQLVQTMGSIFGPRDNDLPGQELP